MHFPPDSDKQRGYLPLAISTETRSPRRWKSAMFMAAGLLAFGYLSSGFLRWQETWRNFVSTVAEVRHPYSDASRDYLWSEISPSENLQWHKCYDGKFDCARLDVPLNWLEPSKEDRVYLAVIRAQARTCEDYRGPVFVNPGGPGGSGVNFLVDRADELQTIVGDNHDVISFDPRGVGASVPRVDCWGSSHMRHDWGLSKIDVVDAHQGVVFDAFAASDAFSRQCEKYINKTSPGLLQHLSTASHARDMLEISEMAGYSKLKYWGISYGSILGGTFAAMFPDRVERLVSDGNIDYPSWYRLDQTNFLEDTDSIMEAFFHFCHKAGPLKCAFYASSPVAIRTRFLALLTSLKKSPVLIPAHGNGSTPFMPELVTYSKLQLLIRTCLYKPFFKFPALAKVMAALEEKNGLPYYILADDGEGPLNPEFCSANGTSPTDPYKYDDDYWDDAFKAITCSDGEPFTDTPESFAEYAAKLQNISKYAGATYTHFKLGCVGRQIRPVYRFPAPWKANTSFPILFIGNTGDNVTPLSSARKNSEAFPGSVVLVQKSWGHASLAAPSTCTAKMIHAYFQDGTLPEKDTYCDQDYELFEEPRAQSREGDDRLSHAVYELSRKTFISRGL